MFVQVTLAAASAPHTPCDLSTLRGGSEQVVSHLDALGRQSLYTRPVLEGPGLDPEHDQG